MASKLERSDRLLSIWAGSPGKAERQSCAEVCAAWIGAARSSSASVRCSFLMDRGLRSTGRLRRWRAKASVLVISPFHDEIADSMRARRRYRPEAVEPTDVPDLEPEYWDAVVLESTLVFEHDPRSFVQRIWRSMRPGGVLAQWGEPLATPAIDEYVRWLRTRLDANLSTNDDVLLDERADGAMDALLASPGSARLPGARGMLPEVILGTLPNAERLELLQYPGLGPHPLFPFPYIGPDAIGRKAAWFASVWIKHP